MQNTVQATLNGILEWCRQGIFFANTKDSPSHALVDELMDLQEMYASSRDLQPVPDVVGASAKRSQPCLGASLQQLVDTIKQRSSIYGAGYMVVAQGGLNEEVERELEREKEEEQEVERELPAMDAAKEQDWDYDKALGDTSSVDLVALTSAKALGSVAARLSTETLRTIPWSCNVTCTANFITSIERSSDDGKLNEYLRPIDAFLMVPGQNGPPSLLLLFE